MTEREKEGERWIERKGDKQRALKQTRRSTKPSEANTAMHAPLHSNLFKGSLFTLSQEVPISFKSFCMISSTSNEDELLSVQP